MTTYKIPANWPRDGSESISICPGYGSPTNGFTCGREKDDDAKWCDRCQDSADLDAKVEKEAQAWRDGTHEEEVVLYPHLVDRE